MLRAFTALLASFGTIGIVLAPVGGIMGYID